MTRPPGGKKGQKSSKTSVQYPSISPDERASTHSLIPVDLPYHYSLQTFIPTTKQYVVPNPSVRDTRDNRISEREIHSQLQLAPSPRQKGSSGYPHQFLNHANIVPGHPMYTKSTRTGVTATTTTNGNNGNGNENDSDDSQASSTTSLYEHPVSANGVAYNYNSKKPRDPPGHIRALTNGSGRFKGVVAHTGNGSTNGGDMVWVPVTDPSQQN